MSAINLRAFHCIFLLTFTFLLYPTYKKEKRTRKLPPVWDLALIALAIAVFGYLILNYTRVAQNGGRLTQMEIVIAGIALLIVFEAARRASGNLAILAAIFLAYNWFGQYLPGRLGHNGYTIPAGTYPNQDEDVQTSAIKMVMFCRGDLDEETVYQLTKTFWENIDKLGEAQSNLKGLTPEEAVNDIADLPLHAGAEKYSNEIGVLQ